MTATFSREMFAGRDQRECSSQARSEEEPRGARPRPRSEISSAIANTSPSTPAAGPQRAKFPPQISPASAKVRWPPSSRLPLGGQRESVSLEQRGRLRRFYVISKSLRALRNFRSAEPHD